MPDFTSALYLGFRHPATALRPWDRLTAGHPAAFSEPTGAIKLAADLAQLQGCERSLLGTSTLHLFWDLFGLLARRPICILFDSQLYAIGRWGVERAMGLGAPAHGFAHLDPENLKQMLESHCDPGARPIAVTDGFCPDCGKPAPLPEYVEILRGLGGMLVVDDTQALGIFGHSRDARAPYGKGGGGMLRWNRIRGPDVIVVCSLAKAFGAPVAALSGARAAVREFQKRSQTRIHCSPPSIASIRAAEHALAINRRHGDELRLWLATLVSRFRRGVEGYGITLTEGLFPVQNLNLRDRNRALHLYRRLLQRRVQAVLRKGSHGEFQLSFLINAGHTADDIDIAVEALHRIAAASVYEGG